LLAILILSVPDVTKPKISAPGLNIPVLSSPVKEYEGVPREPSADLNVVPEIMLFDVMDPDVIDPETFKDVSVPTPVIFSYAPTTDAVGIVPLVILLALRLVRPEPVPENIPPLVVVMFPATLRDVSPVTSVIPDNAKLEEPLFKKISVVPINNEELPRTELGIVPDRFPAVRLVNNEPFPEKEPEVIKPDAVISVTPVKAPVTLADPLKF
jgi:hypothetical protein